MYANQQPRGGIPRRRLRHQIVPFVCLCVMIYFTYHAIYGNHGLIAGAHLDERIKALEMELAELRPVRQNLEDKCSRLRLASLDLDLLDEQSRRLLEVAYPEEIVIFRDKF
ncbi:MAG: septum formation initiator family protein [Parvularculales bacterium]